jgi:hypothetical protein
LLSQNLFDFRQRFHQVLMADVLIADY